MNKLLAIFLIISISLWSCSDDENETNNENTENNTVENTQNNNTEPSKTETQQVKINEDFKVFLDKFNTTNLPYKLDPESDDVSAKIPLDLQVKYLAKAEDLEKADFEEMAEYTDFFFVSNPFKTEQYSAIIYARFEMGSTYYFLCTYDNDGKLISNIDFAAYEIIGAGPQAGQEYNTKGEIDTEHKVTVIAYEETTNYQIKDNGDIVKE